MKKITLPPKEKVKEILVQTKNIFLSPTVTLCILLVISIILTHVSQSYVNASKNRLVPIY